jgi:hypothetical protein
LLSSQLLVVTTAVATATAAELAMPARRQAVAPKDVNIKVESNAAIML